MQSSVSQHTLATGRLGNPAMFENLHNTLEHAGTTPLSLENFPEDTVWIYRSTDLHGTNSYARLNTCFYLFCGEKFHSREDALATLQKTGLIQIIENVKGSIVMFSPSGSKWSMRDVYDLCTLQRGAKEGTTDIYGAFGMNYFIAQGTGADFIHNYVTYYPEASSQVAGTLLIGGSWDGKQRAQSPQALSPMPLWLVNVEPQIIEEYKRIWQVKGAPVEKDGCRTWASEDNPALTLTTQERDADLEQIILMVWEKMLRRRMSIPILPGRNSWLDSPYYSLTERWFPEELGLAYIPHEDGTCLEGTKLRRWYTYLPKEYLGTQEKKVPLLYIIHGGHDEPRAVVEQCGFLKLAGDERLAILAPEHQYIDEDSFESAIGENSKIAMFQRLLHHTLDKYPFLDRSRVYAAGFSRGSLVIDSIAMFRPEMFAAAAPMSGLSLVGLRSCGGENSEEAGKIKAAVFREADDITIPKWKQWKLSRDGKLDSCFPAYLELCGCDRYFAVRKGNTYHLKLDGMTQGDPRGGPADTINMFCTLNGLPEIPRESFDFEKYPFWGLPLKDPILCRQNDTIFSGGDLLYENGAPALRFEVASGMEHALYTGYARRCWEFMRHYRRDLESGKVIHDHFGVV